MNQIIKVNNHNVSVIEWNNERVITTAQLAEVYDASEQQVQQNFNNHQDNFIEGKHYMILRGEELKAFKRFFDDIEAATGVSKFASQLYLWTRRGANRHCKILDTDKAWEQFDAMEEAYFNPVNEKAFQFRDMSPQLQFMINMETEQKRQALEQERQAKELNEVRESQKTITEALTKDITEDFRSWVRRALSAIAESANYQYIGSPQEKHRAVRIESYDRLSAKRPCRLDQRLAHERGRAVEAGASKTRIEAITKLTIIEGDKDLKPVYETVIREMLISYCVTIK